MGAYFNNKILWVVLIVYIALSGYTMAHHEVWGDEVHSWNISKGSASYTDLIANTRYEGHPPGWYTVLWTLSKFTHKVAYMQVVQWIIICSVIFLVLFFSPFPLIAKILLPFGYYFLFEYAVFSRNYAIGILLVCALCLIIRRDFKYKLVLYYLLLFCLSNVHLLAMLLAGSLHLYFLVQCQEQGKKKSTIFLHALLGILIALPALHFIFPPSDSQLNMHFWMNAWNIHQASDFVNAPLRCFLPMPAWWIYNFWNTEFLLEAKNGHGFLKLLNPLISLALLAGAFFILRKNKKSMILFGANLVLSGIVAITIFSLSTPRYAGFLFIGFLAAFWLSCYETQVSQRKKRMVAVLLAIQVFAGIFAVTKDIRLPFSNIYKINEFAAEVPADEKIVTDYWTMNAFVAYMDKPAYCIDMQKELSFVLWGPDITAIQKNPERYSSGLKDLFKKEGLKRVYLLSLAPAQKLFQSDPALAKSFTVLLIDKSEGAIEKGSNLYLYKISDLNASE